MGRNYKTLPCRKAVVLSGAFIGAMTGVAACGLAGGVAAVLPVVIASRTVVGFTRKMGIRRT